MSKILRNVAIVLLVLCIILQQFSILPEMYSKYLLIISIISVMYILLQIIKFGSKVLILGIIFLFCLSNVNFIDVVARFIDIVK